MLQDGQSYYTVVVPWVPRHLATHWHPDTDVGGLSVLTRGAFGTMSDAILWAREHLNGCPYSVRFIPGVTERRED